MQNPLNVGRNRQLRRQLEAIERLEDILVPQVWVRRLRPAAPDDDSGCPAMAAGSLKPEAIVAPSAARPED